jgi:predicted ATP-dependent endonuclease of OLD family
MKIRKIKIENYRLLKDFSINLENELSLVIGKNNTGKTSLLSILDKFLNPSEKSKFAFEDFNLDFKYELEKLIKAESTLEDSFKPVGIKLTLFIEYDEGDNLSNIDKVMMNLDPDNNFIILGFEYVLELDELKELRKNFKIFKEKKSNKTNESKDANYETKDLLSYFLKENHSEYFKLFRKSIEYNKDKKQENNLNFIDLEKEKISIKDIINFKFIAAKRGVSNREIDKTLSAQTSRIYKKSDLTNGSTKAVENFKDKLSDTDAELSKIYSVLFEGVVDKIKKFGGVKHGDSNIKILSTLQHRELLESNATVMYGHSKDISSNEHYLPEHYNGLGYMNLISIIFEIEILIQAFKKNKVEKPSDINLLFIEEPEAHTHPQMQYVFIKNIKSLLDEGIKREDGENRELQCIISTHSSHIVADSDFDDIKYLKKEEGNNVIAKNLKDLNEEYDKNSKQYQFLKQYLTISRAEIFFADKVVLIEGDTERILIPTLMKKFDLDEERKYEKDNKEDKQPPLLSQNISIIEVGAYSHIFERFINFIGIKALIIADLDTEDSSGKKCKASEAVGYSNSALKYFFGESASLEELTKYSIKDKTFNRTDDKWVKEYNGKLCIVYQVGESYKEDGKDEKIFNARSFEDAFIHINRKFINDNKDNFKSLQNKKDFDEEQKDAYDLAENCIKKKTHFALDILYHSTEKLDNWEIPLYIKEGLEWLKQD